MSGTFRSQLAFQTPISHLKLVLCVIKCHQSQIGSTAKAWLPITPQVLCSLNEYWLSNNQGDDTLMIWAVCCFSFFSFIRAGKICTPSNDPADIYIYIYIIIYRWSFPPKHPEDLHWSIQKRCSYYCWSNRWLSRPRCRKLILQLEERKQVPYFVFLMEVLWPDRFCVFSL